MGGEKIELVKETLNYILDLLNERDRLCLILFDDNVERLTPLRCINEKNKSDFTTAVNNIKERGCTNISKGVELAINVLKDRKYKNEVTSIFLLTDGLDNSGLNP